MAQEPAKADGAAEAAPKSKKKLIVILAVVLALAAGGGAAAFFLMKKPEAHQAKGKHGSKAEKEDGHEESAAEGEEEEAAADEEEEEHESGGGGGHGEAGAGPAYLQFETFTVNLLPDPDEKFLQLDLTIEAKDTALADKMKAQMPLMRNRVLMLLTSKKASDIATPEGKAQLSEELLAELKKPLKKGGKQLKIKQVLFTSFVIQ
ncbi:flagellar basal body-associated FliL family protein [Methylophilus sp. VKM B-3414]|uniref:flagellar basal body-associated FliL family protein n=1 Tax=unclassified Methylophilus TaxID=2630143 RepID=UPI00188FE5BB|nr:MULTISPECIES: flagellar basal body-associated FliL family protein [unclassified Methylophilus]MBF5038149.1 flagellar basal body-associated FliL family protein [Methylophilus sp. 13]MDT7850559.1 flagellar basal body-associated FliL family protein [Methylophilus sp. VKM B-3414]BEV07884.1 flagellar basal body-associated FliL family protein [Methylophilus sp. DW102]